MHFGSSTQWVLGFPDRANQLAQDSIALARRLSHAPSLANALWRACDVFALRDDLAAVMTTATELIGLTDVHGLPMPRIYGLEFLGWALTRSGRVAEGIRRMEEAEGLLVRIGTSVQAAPGAGFARRGSADGRALRRRFGASKPRARDLDTVRRTR